MNLSAKKFISIALSFTVLLTQCILAHAIETNIWSERKNQIQLARLPAVIPANPRIQPSIKNRSLNSNLRNTNANPTIIHIQDVHKNTEAQQNIADYIKELIQRNQVDLIALEGAFDSIDLSSFQTYEDQEAIEAVSDYYLREHRISGPIHALLSSGELNISVAGVDDEELYQANVVAYRESSNSQTLNSKQIQKNKTLNNEQKKDTFNKKLWEFDQQVEAYRKGEINLSELVPVLTKGRDDVSPYLQAFQEALKLETTLNFSQVKTERELLLKNLVAGLSKKESKYFLDQTVSYRLGKRTHAEFYGYLKALYEKKNVKLSLYKSVDQYIQYVLLTDSIQFDLVLNEIQKLEKEVYESLVQTEIERSLLAKSKSLYLSDKLIDFALTPNEWEEYSSPRLVWGGREGYKLTPFEDFYLQAKLRDQVIAKNILKEIKNKKAKVAVLVTGGFHSPGISKELEKEKLNIIKWTPKITKVDTKAGSAYLTHFAQEKTPLEKLLAGEKLFLADAPFEGAVPFSLDVIGYQNLGTNIPRERDQRRFGRLSKNQNLDVNARPTKDGYEVDVTNPNNDILQLKAVVNQSNGRRQIQKSESSPKPKKPTVLNWVRAAVVFLVFTFGLHLGSPSYVAAQSPIVTQTILAPLALSQTEDKKPEIYKGSFEARVPSSVEEIEKVVSDWKSKPKSERKPGVLKVYRFGPKQSQLFAIEVTNDEKVIYTLGSLHKHRDSIHVANLLAQMMGKKEKSVLLLEDGNWKKSKPQQVKKDNLQGEWLPLIEGAKKNKIKIVVSPSVLSEKAYLPFLKGASKEKRRKVLLATFLHHNLPLISSRVVRYPNQPYGAHFLGSFWTRTEVMSVHLGQSYEETAREIWDALVDLEEREDQAEYLDALYQQFLEMKELSDETRFQQLEDLKNRKDVDVIYSMAGSAHTRFIDLPIKNIMTTFVLKEFFEAVREHKNPIFNKQLFKNPDERNSKEKKEKEGEDGGNKTAEFIKEWGVFLGFAILLLVVGFYQYLKFIRKNKKLKPQKIIVKGKEKKSKSPANKKKKKNKRKGFANLGFFWALAGSFVIVAISGITYKSIGGSTFFQIQKYPNDFFGLASLILFLLPFMLYKGVIDSSGEKKSPDPIVEKFIEEISGNGAALVVFEKIFKASVGTSRYEKENIKTEVISDQNQLDAWQFIRAKKDEFIKNHPISGPLELAFDNFFKKGSLSYAVFEAAKTREEGLTWIELELTSERSERDSAVLQRIVETWEKDPNNEDLKELKNWITSENKGSAIRISRDIAKLQAYGRKFQDDDLIRLQNEILEPVLEGYMYDFDLLQMVLNDKEVWDLLYWMMAAASKDEGYNDIKYAISADSEKLRAFNVIQKEFGKIEKKQKGRNLIRIYNEFLRFGLLGESLSQAARSKREPVSWLELKYSVAGFDNFKFLEDIHEAITASPVDEGRISKLRQRFAKNKKGKTKNFYKFLKERIKSLRNSNKRELEDDVAKFQKYFFNDPIEFQTPAYNSWFMSGVLTLITLPLSISAGIHLPLWVHVFGLFILYQALLLGSVLLHEMGHLYFQGYYANAKTFSERLSITLSSLNQKNILKAILTGEVITQAKVPTQRWDRWSTKASGWAGPVITFSLILPFLFVYAYTGNSKWSLLLFPSALTNTWLLVLNIWKSPDLKAALKGMPPEAYAMAESVQYKEGISDVLMEIQNKLTRGNERYNWKEFLPTETVLVARFEQKYRPVTQLNRFRKAVAEVLKSPPYFIRNGLRKEPNNPAILKILKAMTQFYFWSKDNEQFISQDDFFIHHFSEFEARLEKAGVDIGVATSKEWLVEQLSNPKFIYDWASLHQAQPWFAELDEKLRTSLRLGPLDYSSTNLASIDDNIKHVLQSYSDRGQDPPTLSMLRREVDLIRGLSEKFDSDVFELKANDISNQGKIFDEEEDHELIMLNNAMVESILEAGGIDNWTLPKFKKLLKQTRQKDVRWIKALLKRLEKTKQLRDSRRQPWFLFIEAAIHRATRSYIKVSHVRAAISNQDSLLLTALSEFVRGNRHHESLNRNRFSSKSLGRIRDAADALIADNTMSRTLESVYFNFLLTEEEKRRLVSKEDSEVSLGEIGDYLRSSETKDLILELIQASAASGEDNGRLIESLTYDPKTVAALLSIAFLAYQLTSNRNPTPQLHVVAEKFLQGELFQVFGVESKFLSQNEIKEIAEPNIYKREPTVGFNEFIRENPDKKRLIEILQEHTSNDYSLRTLVKKMTGQVDDPEGSLWELWGLLLGLVNRSQHLDRFYNWLNSVMNREEASVYQTPAYNSWFMSGVLTLITLPLSISAGIHLPLWVHVFGLFILYQALLLGSVLLHEMGHLYLQGYYANAKTFSERLSITLSSLNQKNILKAILTGEVITQAKVPTQRWDRWSTKASGWAGPVITASLIVPFLFLYIYTRNFSYAFPLFPLALANIWLLALNIWKSPDLKAALTGIPPSAYAMVDNSGKKETADVQFQNFIDIIQENPVAVDLYKKIHTASKRKQSAAFRNEIKNQIIHSPELLDAWNFILDHFLDFRKSGHLSKRMEATYTYFFRGGSLSRTLFEAAKERQDDVSWEEFELVVNRKNDFRVLAVIEKEVAKSPASEQRMNIVREWIKDDEDRYRSLNGLYRNLSRLQAYGRGLGDVRLRNLLELVFKPILSDRVTEFNLREALRQNKQAWNLFDSMVDTLYYPKEKADLKSLIASHSEKLEAYNFLQKEYLALIGRNKKRDRVIIRIGENFLNYGKLRDEILEAAKTKKEPVHWLELKFIAGYRVGYEFLDTVFGGLKNPEVTKKDIQNIQEQSAQVKELRKLLSYLSEIISPLSRKGERLLDENVFKFRKYFLTKSKRFKTGRSRRDSHAFNGRLWNWSLFKKISLKNKIYRVAPIGEEILFSDIGIYSFYLLVGWLSNWTLWVVVLATAIAVLVSAVVFGFSHQHVYKTLTMKGDIPARLTKNGNDTFYYVSMLMPEKPFHRKLSLAFERLPGFNPKTDSIFIINSTHDDNVTPMAIGIKNRIFPLSKEAHQKLTKQPFSLSSGSIDGIKLEFFSSKDPEKRQTVIENTILPISLKIKNSRQSSSKLIMSYELKLIAKTKAKRKDKLYLSAAGLIFRSLFGAALFIPVPVLNLIVANVLAMGAHYGYNHLAARYGKAFAMRSRFRRNANGILSFEDLEEDSRIKDEKLRRLLRKILFAVAKPYNAGSPLQEIDEIKETMSESDRKALLNVIEESARKHGNSKRWHVDVEAAFYVLLSDQKNWLLDKDRYVSTKNLKDILKSPISVHVMSLMDRAIYDVLDKGVENIDQTADSIIMNNMQRSAVRTIGKLIKQEIISKKRHLTGPVRMIVKHFLTRDEGFQKLSGMNPKSLKPDPIRGPIRSHNVQQSLERDVIAWKIFTLMIQATRDGRDNPGHREKISNELIEKIKAKPYFLEAARKVKSTFDKLSQEHGVHEEEFFGRLIRDFLQEDHWSSSHKGSDKTWGDHLRPIVLWFALLFPFAGAQAASPSTLPAVSQNQKANKALAQESIEILNTVKLDLGGRFGNRPVSLAELVEKDLTHLEKKDIIRKVSSVQRQAKNLKKDIVDLPENEIGVLALNGGDQKEANLILGETFIDAYASLKASSKKQGVLVVELAEQAAELKVYARQSKARVTIEVAQFSEENHIILDSLDTVLKAKGYAQKATRWQIYVKEGTSPIFVNQNTFTNSILKKATIRTVNKAMQVIRHQSVLLKTTLEKLLNTQV